MLRMELITTRLSKSRSSTELRWSDVQKSIAQAYSCHAAKRISFGSHRTHKQGESA